MRLDGRVAVITGGASGIGLATAIELGERGCRLVLADIEEPVLDRVVADLSNRFDVIGVPTDVSDKAAVDRLADLTDERCGGVDIVFLNAGVGGSGPLADVTHEEWQWVIGVNLWGPIHGIEAFLPRMIDAGKPGHIILTSSFAGLVANAGMGPYCVTKYGVVALAEVLHREMRGTPIGVSVLCPMLVQTNVGRAARNRPEQFGGPDTSTNTTDDENLIGRVLPPEVIARAAADAIGTDQLYVVTHEEARVPVTRRFARIDAAFATIAD